MHSTSKRSHPSATTTTTQTETINADAEIEKTNGKKLANTLTLSSLLHFHELEEWRKDNEWILTGYRISDGSYLSCFNSLFFWHNETGNIYSHGIGGIIFIFLTIYTYTFVVSDNWDRIIFAFFLSGAIFCLVSSALFHTVSSHSHEVSKAWNKCDYAGITLMIVGSSYPAIYYAFHCNRFEQVLYLSFMTIFGLASLPVIFLDRFSEPKWRWFRAILYLAMGCSGIIPMVHVLIKDGLHYAIDGGSIDWLTAMGLFYICGAILYGSRFPERKFPGKFDYLFNSHQIFHYCVLIAALLHFFGLMEAYTWHQANPCTTRYLEQTHSS